MTKRSWLQLALACGLLVSVLCNVFMIGFVVRDVREPPIASLLMDGVVGTYPAEVRAQFRRLVREERAQIWSSVRKLREDRQRLAAIADSRPFDSSAVEQAMGDVRASTTALQTVVQQLLLQALQDVHQQ